MYELTIRDHFDSAHYIQDYDGDCGRLHGHRWTVELKIQGDKLDSRNMLTDFKVVKRELQALLKGYLDHFTLNDTLEEPNLTAEFLAKWTYSRLSRFTHARLASVTVWESPDCGATYYESEQTE